MALGCHRTWIFLSRLQAVYLSMHCHGALSLWLQTGWFHTYDLWAFSLSIFFIFPSSLWSHALCQIFQGLAHCQPYLSDNESTFYILLECVVFREQIKLISFETIGSDRIRPLMLLEFALRFICKVRLTLPFLTLSAFWGNENNSVMVKAFLTSSSMKRGQHFSSQMTCEWML